jgi:hypothetical protein
VALAVVSFASYLTTNIQEWRSDDHNASKFIKAIKGDKLNKYAYVPVLPDQPSRYLDNTNREDAVAWFGEMACDYLLKFHLNPEASVSLVPIPSTEAVVETTFERFPALRLARALADELRAAKLDAEVADVLRWTEEMPKTRSGGGTRDPAVLFPRLTLIGKVESSTQYILVDDVCTSGGHLRAAAARLRGAGASALLAVCAGRTSQVAVDEPFKPSLEELDDYDPPE